MTLWFGAPHLPSKFGSHRDCSGNMSFLVEGEDSTCPRLDPPLLYISKAHGMPCSRTGNFRTLTQQFEDMSNDKHPILMMMMMMMMMMMINCFRGMVDRWKAFNFISSRDHYQISSLTRISNSPRAGFEPAKNLTSDFVEWSRAVVITTTPRRNYHTTSIAPPLLYVKASHTCLQEQLTELT